MVKKAQESGARNQQRYVLNNDADLNVRLTESGFEALNLFPDK